MEEELKNEGDLMSKISEVLGWSLDFSIGERDFAISLLDVLMILFIIVLTRVVIWFVKKALNTRVSHNKLDKGKAYAIKQIVTYLFWTIAIVYMLDYIGVKITALLVGSTALFVGLGLGLQDTFRDFVAGFIILMERTVTVGDIVEVDGVIGRVLEVGLRTTFVQTRDDIYLIIPNQRLTNQQVINWSQSKRVTRFSVTVGVAYGSDTKKVKELLLEAVKEHTMVAKNPDPIVHFKDFGNSSLDFQVHFYSSNLFRIETVKSDIRFSIDQKFRDNGITIPFPQRDLWIRNWQETEGDEAPKSAKDNDE
ncbi:MAG: mechanosensitive ion channel [Flavobacteriia bacterium]|nr:mechanosensitive ion channel [Flavobacteriia bacterium]